MTGVQLCMPMLMRTICFQSSGALICGQGIHLCLRLRATSVCAVTVVSQCMGYTSAAEVYTAAY